MSNQKNSLSEFIQRDLHQQTIKLQNDLALAVGEVTINDKRDHDKEILMLRNIMKSWRILSLKTYDQHAVRSFIVRRECIHLRHCLDKWHQYVEQTNLRRVKLYITKEKKQKQLIQTILKKWRIVIESLQLNQIQNYEANKLYVKQRKRRCFKGWNQFVIKRNRCLVNQQELELIIQQSLIQKYYQILRKQFNKKESQIETRVQTIQKQQLGNILIRWLEAVQKLKLLEQTKTQFMVYQAGIKKQQIFQFIKQKSIANYLKRRLNKLGQLSRMRCLYIKGMSGIQKNKCIVQGKRCLKELQRQHQLRVVIRSLQETYQLQNKYLTAQKHLNLIRLSNNFRKLKQNTQIGKYKHYTSEFCHLFRTNQQYKFYFSQWKLYYSYRLRKQEMNTRMMQLHLIKYSKQILRKWNIFNKKYRDNKQKFIQIQLMNEYNIKRKIFRKMVK